LQPSISPASKTVFFNASVGGRTKVGAKLLKKIDIQAMCARNMPLYFTILIINVEYLGKAQYKK
jgi:hypothetical protein